jgi:peptidoglycan hydrolase CwlO-like protein
MYKRPNTIQSKPTIYNTPRIDEKENKTENAPEPTQKITFLREAHVTEITLGSQTLRVMDAGHIQGVINTIEKQDRAIKELNKTVNTLNRNIQTLHQQLSGMKTEITELKGKLNGNFL